MSALEGLILLSYEDDNPVQTCEENILLEFLQGCVLIKDISLEGNFSSFLNDSFLERLFMRNALDSLEIFDIQGTKVPLTIKSAEKLLTLPNLAEWRLSQLSLSEEEMRKIVQEVKKNGWKVWFRN